jgi:hypothetical protein
MLTHITNIVVRLIITVGLGWRELTEEEFKATRNEHRRNKRHDNKRQGSNAKLLIVDAITVIPPCISSLNIAGTSPLSKAKAFWKQKREELNGAAFLELKKRSVTSDVAI